MRSLLLVLVIVQDSKTRGVVRMVLEGAGHRVIDAAGSPQALALLSNGLNPDLVLCEVAALNSPDRTQYRQFLQYTPAQNICLITRASEQELRCEASELGVRHFLNKPVTRGDLESVTDSLNAAKGQLSVIPAIAPVSRRSAPLMSDTPEALSSIPRDMPAVPIMEELGDNTFSWRRLRKCWKFIAR